MDFGGGRSYDLVNRWLDNWLFSWGRIGKQDQILFMGVDKVKKGKKKGRPTKYNPIYAEQLVAYFDIEPIIFRDVTITYKDGSTKEIEKEEAAPLPFLSGFAKRIGVEHDTLLEWRKYPEFSVAYKKAKRLQTEFIMVNALRNNYNSGFACFTLKNVAKWRDEEDQPWTDKHEISNADNKPFEVKITYANR